MMIRRILWLVIAMSLLGVPSVVSASTSDACKPAKDNFKIGTSEHVIQSGGLERRYLLYVPPSYDSAQPTPLVLSMHGFTASPEQQATLSRWDQLARAEKAPFIVAYPGGAEVPSRWNAGVSKFPGAGTADDVKFLRDMITEISKALCIDPTRIFANGYSAGGGMAYRLACEASDLIAAIGGVAGAYNEQATECKPIHPLSVIAFHGTKDPFAIYNGVSDALLIGAPDWTKRWAVFNGCDLKSEPLPAKGDVSGIRYTGCKEGAEVVFYTIDGGGHTWPGGPTMPFVGKTSADIDATKVMWEFFKAHPLATK